jgi:hypothetical protein
MDDRRGRRMRVRVEAVLTVVSAALFVLTLAVPDWIEEVFGVAPDAGSGETEWLLVTVLLVITVVLAAVTLVEWRRLRPA